MVGQEVLDALRGQGWSLSQGYLAQAHRHPALFAVARPLGPELDVIVAVHQEVNQFVVWSVLKEAGVVKLGEVMAHCSTLQKALLLVRRACKRIDAEEADPM